MGEGDMGSRDIFHIKALQSPTLLSIISGSSVDGLMGAFTGEIKKTLILMYFL